MLISVALSRKNISKLIILIAGVHNNLRSQTQARINEGFIGFDWLAQNRVGVGASSTNDDKSRWPITFTNTQDDFSARSQSIAAMTPEGSVALRSTG